MRRRLRLAEPALKDIDEIWSYTAEVYDVDQADAYEALLWQAIRDIRDAPERPSSRKRDDLGQAVRTYHIELSKGRSGTGIKAPRHVLIYTLHFEGEVRILRILHDRMKPEHHLS